MCRAAPRARARVCDLWRRGDMCGSLSVRLKSRGNGRRRAAALAITAARRCQRRRALVRMRGVAWEAGVKCVGGAVCAWQVFAGNPSKEGIVWPHVCEIALVGALGMRRKRAG